MSLSSYCSWFFFTMLCLISLLYVISQFICLGMSFNMETKVTHFLRLSLKHWRNTTSHLLFISQPARLEQRVASSRIFLPVLWDETPWYWAQKLTRHLEGGVLCSSVGALPSDLLTNISAKKNIEWSQRDVKDVQKVCVKKKKRRRRKIRRRKSKRRWYVQIWKALATCAANKFITQQGCLVLTLILGPERWVMNIVYDKWSRLTSEAVVGADLHSPDHLDNTWCLGRRGRNVSSIPSDALRDRAVGFLLLWSSGPCRLIPESGIIKADSTWE